MIVFTLDIDNFPDHLTHNDVLVTCLLTRTMVSTHPAATRYPQVERHSVASGRNNQTDIALPSTPVVG